MICNAYVRVVPLRVSLPCGNVEIFMFGQYSHWFIWITKNMKSSSFRKVSRNIDWVAFRHDELQQGYLNIINTPDSGICKLVPPSFELSTMWMHFTKRSHVQGGLSDQWIWREIGCTPSIEQKQAIQRAAIGRLTNKLKSKHVVNQRVDLRCGLTIEMMYRLP